MSTTAQHVNDVAELQALIALQRDQLRMKDAQLAELSRRLQHLYEALRAMRAQRFGRSSEVTPHDQFSLCFNEAEIVVTLDETVGAKESESIPERREKRRRAGSVTLPPDTPVETIIHDLPASQKVCPDDGHALHCIGEEVSEQLDIQPAKVTIVRHVRPKYGCRCCEQGVHIAPLPPQPLPGCLATANTAALITVNKYVDHQPLYRQSETLTRSGVQISRATLAYWLIDLAELCRPLINLLIDTLHSSRWMQLDETPVQVLNEDGRPATSRSWMWVRRTVIDGKTIILFHYDPSRGAGVVKTLLDGYTGTYLQHDGYAAYEADDADANAPPPSRASSTLIRPAARASSTSVASPMRGASSSRC
jgi:transposase